MNREPEARRDLPRRRHNFRGPRVLSPPRSPVPELCSTFGPSLQASRSDPERRLTAWVPPCSRFVHRRWARSAPRCPRPSPAEGPRRFRRCRSRPAGAAEEQNKVPRRNGVSWGGRGELGLDSAEPGLRLRKLSESGAQVGVAVLMPHDMFDVEVRGFATPTHGIIPPGKPHSPSPPGVGDHHRRRARGLQGLLPGGRGDPGRRKPDVACLGRNPLLALGDVGHWTSDFGL